MTFQNLEVGKKVTLIIETYKNGKMATETKQAVVKTISGKTIGSRIATIGTIDISEKSGLNIGANINRRVYLA